VNLTDLRDTLDERSSDAPFPGVGTRVEGVRARVRATRQRRAVGGALAVVAVLVAGYAVITNSLTNSRPQPPTVTPTPTLTVNGFPEYHDGAHLIETRNAPISDGEMTFIVDGSPLGWAMSARCASNEPGRELSIRWQLNGKPLMGHSCDAYGGGGARPDESLYDPDRLRPELKSMFTATIEAKDGKPLPMGTFAVAISERVAYADYPLPPRPATLKPLDPPSVVNVDPAYGIMTVDSDADDPTRPKTIVLTVDTPLSIDMVSQTPGYLHVIVDGNEVATAEWWDYELGLYGMTLDQPGQHTVTFVPEHLSGAWRAVVRPS